MRILHAGMKRVPSREGGVEIVVEELATRMAEQGHEVTLFNRKRKGYEKITEYQGCKVEEIFTIDKKSLDAIVYAFFATLKVRRMLKKKQVDIVHFHAEGPCFFLNLLPKKKKRPDAKIVVTIHGLDWQRGKWGGFASKILKSGEKKAVKYADEIIVLSENNRRYFLEEYGRATEFIPNGTAIPEPHEAEIIKEKYGLNMGDYVLFLARIVPEKGLHYLVEAWKQVVKQTGTNKKLVIAGGASHSDDYYKEICEKVKGDDTIIMTGFVEGQELKELYSNAYLYVLPSEIEGMPMSLLEALSYGNVCLVSDIAENTEVINESCHVFKSGDVESLTQELKDIIGLGLTAHTDVLIPHTWSEVVAQTLEVYAR